MVVQGVDDPLCVSQRCLLNLTTKHLNLVAYHRESVANCVRDLLRLLEDGVCLLTVRQLVLIALRDDVGLDVATSILHL